jgi:dienelactone hydrolase
MFEYFDNNYPWNLAVVTALGMGAVVSDVDAACRPLRAVADGDVVRSSAAWVDAWSALAARLRRQAERDEREQHRRSAGEKYVRGALYELMAERALRCTDPLKLATYRDAMTMFRRGIALRGDVAELVEVPYRDAVLPAIFVPAVGKRPAPCIIQFNGFDWVKEFNYLPMAEEYARRGIATLFCDQPGSGGALRLHGLAAEIESEHAAAACIDYLTPRREVDAERIGIMAASLGGYYAPRAAAFEKRLACCVAWGAFYDAGEVLQRRIAEGDRYARSVPDVEDQMLWVTGTTSLDAAIAFMRRLTLKDVARQITCPLLIVHGGADRQIPIDHGEKTYDAACNSRARKLVVLGPEDGGVEHCSIDNFPLVRDLAADWIADTLGIAPDATTAQ